MGFLSNVKKNIKGRIAYAKAVRADNKAFDRTVKYEYESEKKRGRLVRARKEGYKAGRTGQGKRGISLKTDGPDPFGLFGSSTRQTTATKRRKRRGNTTIVIRQVGGSGIKRKRKKDKGGYLDQLL